MAKVGVKKGRFCTIITILLFAHMLLVTSLQQGRNSNDENYIVNFNYKVNQTTLMINITTYWGNTTIRVEDNETWLLPYDSAASITIETTSNTQPEGVSYWQFNYTVGLHNITVHVYNNQTELFVKNFAIGILEITMPLTDNTIELLNEPPIRIPI